MMRKQNFLRNWKEQKQNNRGSSIILVLAVIAIVGILAAVLLSVSLMNYRMKVVNLHSQKNFYDAETVLNEIKTGLEDDVSYAAGKAWAAVLTDQYDKKTKEERETAYRTNYEGKLRARIEDTVHSYPGPNAYHYNVDYLLAKVSDETKAAVKELKIESVDGNNVLNVQADKGICTIKNLSVTYIDQKNYMTKITSDIVLTCPPMDYAQKTSAPNLLSYALVADQNTSAVGGTVTIRGSAYLGMYGADFNTVNVNVSPVGKGNLVTGGELYVHNGATLEVENAQTWAHEIQVDSATLNIRGKQTYLADDLVLKGQGKTEVSISDNLNLFGNPETLKSAQCASEVVEKKADGTTVTLADCADNDQASYSSSILLNGKNATLDLTGLKTFKIAGTAYINTAENNKENFLLQKDVQMGQSVSVKSDQRAYLLEGKYVASYCAHGGINPMSESTYQQVLDEIAQKHPELDKNSIPYAYFLSEDGTVPDVLKNMGVSGVTKQVYRLKTDAGTVDMVYFFPTFVNTQDARKYGAANYNVSAISAHLDEKHYNTSIKYADHLVNGSDTDLTHYETYFNGSVLVPEQNRLYYDLKAEEKAGKENIRQSENQDRFAGLKHKLTENYASGLTAEEKNQTVYENLVKDVSGDVTLAISSGLFRVFDSAEKACTAIVANGSFTWDDAQAAKTPNLHVIIASGNVALNRDFSGLILCGGDLILASGRNVTVSADAAEVSRTLGIKNADGVCAADYLVSGESYLTEDSDGTTSGDVVDFGDYVTFQNWKKQ